jgi:hypothetical protein
VSILHVMSAQVQADTAGQTSVGSYAQHHPTGKYPDAVGHVLSDLGELDGIFGRDTVTNLAHAVVAPIERATSATRGPNGGLVPTFHFPPTFHVPVEGIIAGGHNVEAQVPRFRDTLRGELDRLRQLVSR